MSVYFSTDDRKNKRGDFLIRLSWHYNGTRFQTTVGLTTKHRILNNRVEAGCKKNSKNMTPEKINVILEKIEHFINECETYAWEKKVKLTSGTMRGLFKDYKSINFTQEKEIKEKWIISSPSDGLYWQKYDGGFYKKLCVAVDSSDSTKKYVIYQELFGHSRIFSIIQEEFYGNIVYLDKIVKRFTEISADIALMSLL